MYHSFLGHHFDRLMPQHGSLIDMSLSYKPLSKTDDTNC
jgi:hypothetical protein